MNVNKNSSLLGRYSTKEDIIFKNQNDKSTLLLLEKPKENTQILKDIGFDNYILKVEKEAHIKNSKIVISELFGKPSFLGSEIKKVCNDYDLTISIVSNYKGAPFKDLDLIIKNFMDNNSEDIIIPKETKLQKVYYNDEVNSETISEEDIDKEYPFTNSEGKYKRIPIVIPEKIEKKSKIKISYSNWFIMAPREAFHGDKKNTCCTLFYRDNGETRDISENDVFTEVYSWGSNYSEIRKYNYFLKSINWEKEIDFRKKQINKNEISNQNISLIISLFFLIIFNTILYFYSFIAMSIATCLILIFLYLSIKKPCKEYYMLWKI